MGSLERSKFTKRTKASIINDFIVFNAIKELTNMRGIHFNPERRPFCVYIEDKFKLRFKKFDCSLRPSYIPTHQMLDLINQVDIPLPEMPYEATHIIAGYVWRNATQTNKDIYITCPNGKHNEWELKISILKSPTIAQEQTTGTSDRDHRRVFPKDIQDS
jgi:hypothetical protein